jgi:Malectin domain
MADQYYNDGFTFSNSAIAIAGTLDDPIYQSERWGEFTYEVPVPKGDYEVIIHFAEMYVHVVTFATHFLRV